MNIKRLITAALLSVVVSCLNTACQTSSAATSRPAPASAAAPAPAPARTETVTASGSGRIESDLLLLTKRVPSEAALGENYSYDIVVTPKADLGSLTVEDTLGAGMEFVSSSPRAEVSGNRLTWKFSPVPAGTPITLRTTVKAAQVGTLTSCTTFLAIPQICLSTVVGQPALAITKTGPAQVKVGETATYQITVSNRGTAVARNVTITDKVPRGLSHASGASTVPFTVGDLAPGASRSVEIALRAGERGRFCNVAEAVGSNVSAVTAEACTVVVQPGLSIEKSGPQSQFFGRNATYAITVANTGDTPLSNVQVVDTAPAATRLVSAAGATINGNMATWTIPSLAAGAKQSFGVVLTSTTAGSHCNSVTASSEGLSDSAQACTVWSGIGALLVEMVDEPDPIQVGETTTYTVRITNQGTSALTNVTAVAAFEDTIAPVSSSTGSVSGKQVRFPAVASLAPKASVTYTITARGVSTGDHRATLTVTAVELPRPVTEEESTTVY